MDALAGNVALCPPALAQHAGVAAFSPRATRPRAENVARYAAARELLLAGCPSSAGPGIAPADGAFYLYADVSASGLDSITWCARLLDEAGVALTPGHRLRPRRRAPVGAAVVRVVGRGREPGGGPDRRLAADAVTDAVHRT